MSAHTPGPWHVDGNMVRCDDRYSIIATCSYCPDSESASRNARLIAAAPDLYAALSIVERVLRGESAFDIVTHEGLPLGEVVRAALAKAQP